MVRLALVAMLLVALAPTVSRTLAAGADGPAARAVQMCTMTGLQTKVLTALSIVGGAMHHDRGDPATTPHDDGDACGYCSLVVPLPVLLVLLSGLLLPLLPAPVFHSRIVPVRVLRNLRGLGAQAPPLPF